MNNRAVIHAAFQALFLAVLFSTSLPAQTAQVTGRVTDQAGAVVPNATISIENQNTGTKRNATSNQDGYYTAPLLQPGLYRISSTVAGFKPVEHKDIQLVVDQNLRLDFLLEVGSISEKMEVTARSELLESQTAAMSHLVQGKQVQDLPLLGRNPYALGGLAAGVRTAVGMNDVPVDMVTQASVSINGQRGNQNEFLLDGAPNTGAGQNQPIIYANVDSVQEFRVETNAYSAEYGRAAGGVFNVVTKGGANDVHFGAYDFLRNDKLNANDWFANRAGQTKAPFRFNQFGGTLGGPVVIPHLYDGHNKTFFFVSAEFVRFKQGVTFNGTVPDPVLLKGDFSNLRNAAGAKIAIYDPATTRPNPAGAGFIRDAFANNLIPASRINPVAANISKFWPAPNTAGNPFTGVGDFLRVDSNNLHKNTFSARLDHNFSDKDRFFARLSYDNTPYTRANPYGDGNVASPVAGPQTFNRYNAVAEETHIFQPSLIGELRASFSRLGNFDPVLGGSFDITSLGLPASLAQQTQPAAFPAIIITGYSLSSSVANIVAPATAAFGSSAYINIGMNNYALQGSLTKSLAKHTLKTGAEYRIIRFNSLQANASANQFTFVNSWTQGANPAQASTTAGAALASFLLGVPGGTFAPPPAMAQQTVYAGVFLQDEWKIAQSLTLNLGIRYEIEYPRTDRFNQFTNFSYGATPPLNAPGLNLHGALSFVGVNGVSRYQAEPDCNNLAPRVGIAWHATPKTVIRSGGGVFYATLTGIGTAPAQFGLTGFQASTDVTTSLDGLTPIVSLSNPFPNGLNKATGSSLGPATFLGQSIAFYDRANLVPYNLQWNFDIQRELPKGVLLDIGYVGSHALKLPQDRSLNQLPDSALALGDSLRTLLPNPFYGQFQIGPLAQPTVSRAQLLRPYPQFQDVTSSAAGWASSNYNALQVKFEKRYARGFTIVTSYTYSKIMDYATGVFNGEAVGTGTGGSNSGTQNWNNLHAEYSPSALDQTHRLIVNGIYELPFMRKQQGALGRVLGGWEIGAIGSFYSGGPLGITSSTNNTFAQGGGQRPNWTGVNPELDSPTPARWFDIAQFSNAPAYRFGTTPRTVNSLRSDGARQLDLTLHKYIKLNERLRLQFRADAFNLSNTPRFAPPNLSFGNQQFGVVSAMENQPRVLQFALKLLM